MTEHGSRWRNILRSNKAVWAAAGLLVVTVACLLVAREHGKSAASDNTAPAPVVVDVARAIIRPMETVVIAQGTLVPSQGASAKVAAVSAGRLLSVRVREGAHVSAGQVVAVVDCRVQQAQAASAVSALRGSRIQADQARLTLEAAASDQANAVKVARLELQSAEAELHKLRGGARPQEIAQADQAVNQAQATYDRAATELDRVKFLFEKGVAAKRQLDDATTALAVSKSGLETAKQQADLVRAGTRQEDLQSAELHVETAKANLDQAQRGSVQVAAKKREAEAAAESVNQKSADLTAAQTAARYAELRSPISGVVIHRLLNPGDMADPSSPVIEVAGLGTLDLSASIPADEGSTVRPGMPVRICATCAPCKPVIGTVIDVGQIDPQTGLLSVRVTVGNPGTLKAGAFATASIIVRTDRNAIVVPKQAVVSKNGKPSVFVVGADDTAHERTVTTGVEDAAVVQIVTGIAPGERVIRLGQYELSDGDKVRTSGQ